jgi:uncharacterized glyoxalase superfamily protein PhnB
VSWRSNDLDAKLCRTSGLVLTMHAVQQPGRTIVPTLRYRDVAAAVDWLCTAFGFERHLVVPGEDGAIQYAELTFGDGMIMLGPVQDSAFDKLMTQPADAGGAETQICYLFVADAGEHCDRAKAAGAEIVLDITEEDGAGRGYSCRDLEGHIWNFGTYNPWKRRSVQVEQLGPLHRRSIGGRGLRRAAAVAGLLVTMAASALAVEWALGATNWASLESEPAAVTGAAAVPITKSDEDQLARAMKDFREQLAKERSAKEAAERGAHTAREQLAQERQAKEVAERAKEAAERAAKEAREQLAKIGAEQAAGDMRELREQLARERISLATAQRIAQETREQLALAERAAQAIQEQLAAERSVREAAEHANRQAQEQSAEQDTERAKQAREKAAKERAANEARERQRNARRPAPRPQATAGPAGGITPLTVWPR